MYLPGSSQPRTPTSAWSKSLLRGGGGIREMYRGKAFEVLRALLTVLTSVTMVGQALAFSTLSTLTDATTMAAPAEGQPTASTSTATTGSRRTKSTPWMRQSFNAQAVASMGRIARHPALAVPHLSVPHIGDLDFEELRKMGCKGVVFDKDNTLTAPYADDAHPLVVGGLRRCMEAFEGKVCIMSNSAGTRDDVDYVDAIRIETALGIPVIRHDEKKPGGIEEVLDFFSRKLVDGEKVRLDELCFVGDRLLTDVVFGNLHGMLTVHTQPLTLEGDNRPAAMFRFLEKKVFLDFLHERWSVHPLPHGLCPEGAAILDRRKHVAQIAQQQWGPLANPTN